MLYKYISENNLLNKQNYMYSEYGGQAFLKAYIDSRDNFIKKYSSDVSSHKKEINNIDSTRSRLIQLKRKVENEGMKSYVKAEVDDFTKSFEVRKRIYSAYDEAFKPLASAVFDHYDNYLVFAEILDLAYKQTRCMKYISCLLKVNDTLLSIYDRLDKGQNMVLANILCSEKKIVSELANLKKVDMEGIL